MCMCFESNQKELLKEGYSMPVELMFNKEKHTILKSNKAQIIVKKNGRIAKDFILFAAYCPFCGDKYESYNHS